MILNRIIIEGFASFSSPTEFYFEKAASFNLVAGNNKDHEKLGGNAVGKSSLFEAVCFCLFGKTSKNRKATVVKNIYSGNECKIILEFSLVGNIYTLIRTTNPNKIYLNNKEKTQEELTEFLGFDFNEFLFSSFIAQKTSKFFNLTPPEKLETITKILNLSNYDSYISFAKDEVKKYKASLVKKESIISNIKNNIATTETRIKQLTEKIKNQSQLSENEKNELLLKKSKIEEILNTSLKSDKEILENAKISITKNINEINNEIVKESLLLQNTHKLYESAIKEHEQLKKALEEKETKVNSFLNGGPLITYCPTCEQALEEASKDALLQKYTTESKNLQNQKTSLTNRLAEIVCVEGSTLVKINKLKEEIKPLKEEFNILETMYTEVLSQINDTKTQYAIVLSNLEKHNESKNQLNEFLEIEQKELVKLNNDLLISNKEVQVLKQSTEIYSFWAITGFKEIKLKIINNILFEFELEVNKYLHKFGLPTWKVKFDIALETKTAGTKKGFFVSLKKDSDDLDYFSIEELSGGELQRFVLVGTLGLISLLRSKCKTLPNILVFDEPTQFLSPEGIDELLTTLKSFCEKNSLVGYLIDHRNLTDFDFSSIIEVSIKNKQSSIKILT